MKLFDLFRFGPKSIPARATNAGEPAKEITGYSTGIKESVQPAVGDTRDSADGSAGVQFRRLTQHTRDFQPFTFIKIRELAWYLFQRNPLAKRLITIIIDFTLGDDLQVAISIKKRNEDGTVEDTGRKDAQAVWDEFANDPINAYYDDIDTLIQDLFLFGELCLPVTVEKQSGKVRMGYLDVGFVKELKHDKTGKQVEDIVHASELGTEKILKAIRVDIDPDSKTYNKLIGAAFYHRVNRVMNQTRGHSELMEMVDWLDALDQFLFNTLEGSAVRNAFLWWLKLTGKTESEIKDMTVETPTTASVKITNEKAEWSVLSPSFNDATTPEHVRMYKNFILGGKGYPEHFFGDAGNAGIATSEQMSIPTMRMLKRQQKKVKQIIRQHVAFVVQNAPPETLKLQSDEFIDIQISAFDFERADAAVIAAGFVQTVTALVTAASRNWISDDKAKQVIDGFLQRYGVEPDQDETVDEIAAENDDDDLSDTMIPPNGDRPPGVTPSKKSANAKARQQMQPTEVD